MEWSLSELSSSFQFFFCFLHLPYAFCRDDEDCSFAEELGSSSAAVAGDGLQLDSVDTDVGNELENNENNNNSNSKYVASQLANAFFVLYFVNNSTVVAQFVISVLLLSHLSSLYYLLSTGSDYTGSIMY